MEGPSLVILKEELQPFVGKKVARVSGNSSENISCLKGKKLTKVQTWGKHLLLSFSGEVFVKIHFLMWGSYRINETKDSSPRLSLTFGKQFFNIYSSSVKFLEEAPEKIYDFSADVMSEAWIPQQTLKKLRAKPFEFACDALMRQETFAGVGNIIKNEVLFRTRINPWSQIGALSPRELKLLVEEARNYSFQFFEWKKRFELKKHWLIMRKKTCPVCGEKVKREVTGELERWSFYCPNEQPVKTFTPQEKPKLKKSKAKHQRRESGIFIRNAPIGETAAVKRVTEFIAEGSSDKPNPR